MPASAAEGGDSAGGTGASVFESNRSLFSYHEKVVAAKVGNHPRSERNMSRK